MRTQLECIARCSWRVVPMALLLLSCAEETPHEAVAQQTVALDASSTGHGSGILWRALTGELHLWDMASSTDYRDVPLGTPDPSWFPIATGDFNRDGAGDILWRNFRDAQLGTWSFTDTQVSNMSAATPTTAPTGSVYTYAGDLDGDGVSDIVWASIQSGSPRNYVTQRWFMNAGSTVPRAAATLLSPTDRVQGIGNFDNDSLHRADILYRDPASGNVTIEFNNSGTRTSIGGAGNEWQIVGIGDFNRDGFSDLLWYQVNVGTVGVWTLQGSQVTSMPLTGTVSPDSGWTIQGIADVDHDGISDILWRHGPSSVLSVWVMSAPDQVREYGNAVPIPTNLNFVGVLELGPPVAPSALSVGSEAFESGRTVVNVDFNAQRNGDQVEVWEDFGGQLSLRQRLPYSSISGVFRMVKLDTSIFQGGRTACFYLKTWEQGRVSALSNRLCAPGLPAPTVSLDWENVEMFGGDSDGDGAVDLTPPRQAMDALSSGRWPVTLDACGSTDAAAGGWIATYDWTIRIGLASTHISTSTCKSTPLMLPRGSYPTTLRVTTQDGRSASTAGTITVKNTLLVSLGDSYASGEGNPVRDAIWSIDKNNQLALVPPVWGRSSDTACHRSANSGPARAALALERADPHSSVIFLSVACSGAVVANLIDTPQSGTSLTQVQQVKNVFCPPSGNTGQPLDCASTQMPKIDALLLSITGNDVEFSNIIKTCAASRLGCHLDGDFLSREESLLAAVPEKLGDLQQKLAQLNTAGVFITEYPDSVHPTATTICPQIVMKGAVLDATLGITIGTKEDAIIGLDDLLWASDFIGRLNRSVEAKVESFGWNFVGGVNEAFFGHAYCVDASHWAVRYDESERFQADDRGTLHPNWAGHSAYAQQILKALMTRGIGGASALANIPSARVVPPLPI